MTQLTSNNGGGCGRFPSVCRMSAGMSPGAVSKVQPVTSARRAASDRLGWDEIFDAEKSGWDSIVPFLGVAQLLAAESSVVVDGGGGRGSMADDPTRPVFHDLRGAGRTVIGIDLDP